MVLRLVQSTVIDDVLARAGAGIGKAASVLREMAEAIAKVAMMERAAAPPMPLDMPPGKRPDPTAAEQSLRQLTSAFALADRALQTQWESHAIAIRATMHRSHLQAYRRRQLQIES